jgi:hypothetical protein
MRNPSPIMFRMGVLPRMLSVIEQRIYALFAWLLWCRAALKSDLPHFRCRLTRPKTCKQLKRFGMQRFFQEVGSRLSLDVVG